MHGVDISHMMTLLHMCLAHFPGAAAAPARLRCLGGKRALESYVLYGQACRWSESVKANGHSYWHQLHRRHLVQPLGPANALGTLRSLALSLLTASLLGRERAAFRTPLCPLH